MTASRDLGRGFGGGMPRELCWHHTQEKQLLALVASKRTAAEIAEIMGLSRSAILGKCKRLRRAGVPVVFHRPRGGMKGERKRKSANVHRANRVKFLQQINDQNRITKIVVPKNEPKSLDLSIIDLKPDHCRWPHGDRAPYSFCGHATYGLVYCPFHQRLGMVRR